MIEMVEDVVKVVCRRCCRSYKAVSVETLQGVDCAASVYKTEAGKWVIVGHYPSSHDLELFEFSHEPDTDVQWIAPICDTSIDDLVITGEIKLIRQVRADEHFGILSRPVKAVA